MFNLRTTHRISDNTKGVSEFVEPILNFSWCMMFLTLTGSSSVDRPSYSMIQNIHFSSIKSFKLHVKLDWLSLAILSLMDRAKPSSHGWW